MAERGSWRRADVALAWLVVLAASALCLALGLSALGFAPFLAVLVSVCRRSLDEAVTHGVELGRVLLFLPLALGLLLALLQVFRLIRLTRRWIAVLGTTLCTPPRRLNRVAGKCGLLHQITLVQAEQRFVFTHGLLWPRVWLSTSLLEALATDELEAVLRHESHHRAARDPLKMLAAHCFSRALFFVPVARDLCRAYCLGKEIAADAHATRSMGTALPLARALRKLLAAPLYAAPDAALISELGVAERRLMALLEPSRPQPLVELKHLRLSLLGLLLLVGLIFAPAAGHLPSFAECPVSTTVQTATRVRAG